MNRIDKVLEEMGETVEDGFWPGDEKQSTLKTAEQCANCDSLVDFVGNQWRRSCPKCGLNITVTRRCEKPNNSVKCRTCDDKGVVIYQAQVIGNIYDYAARCPCFAGGKYTGRNIPLITEVSNAPKKIAG